MRIMEVIVEAIDPIGAYIMLEGHIEGLNKGEGDNKIIIEANSRTTMDSLTLLIVAIIIITMAIIKAEVAMAVVVTFIDHMVAEVAITEAITIINTINITHMMMELSLNNMVHHANHSPKHCFKGEHYINNLMEKRSLGSNNQHQNGLYQ